MKIRPLIVTGLVTWAAAVITAAVAGRSPAPSAPATRTLTATAPAAGVETVAIDAGRGSVTLAAAPGDELQAVVTVSNDTRGFVILGSPLGDPAHADVEAVAEGRTLRLRLTGAMGLDERWVVRVPARLSAAISLTRGRIEVSGLAGGVRARADSGVDSTPGAILVDVPRGPLDLALGVGTIDASAGESPQGGISVRSHVGHAKVVLDGHEILADHEPGPGERVRLTGDGPDAIALSVSVGDAHLRIR